MRWIRWEISLLYWQHCSCIQFFIQLPSLQRSSILTSTRSPHKYIFFFNSTLWHYNFANPFKELRRIFLYPFLKNFVMTLWIRLMCLRKLPLYTFSYITVIDQAWGQDGWILAKFFFYLYMDQDKVDVHKNAKRRTRLSQAGKIGMWPIRTQDLLHITQALCQLYHKLVY